MNLRNRRGAALLIVLGTVAFLMVISMHLVRLSQASRVGSRFQLARVKARYGCESAAARMCWMLLKERRTRPNRDLERLYAARKGMKDVWFSDDTWRDFDLEHSDGISCKARIKDWACGLRLDQGTPGESLRKVGAGFVCAFPDELDDYVDGDHLIRSRGREQSAYDLPMLPRNGHIQFKDELHYIPGFAPFCMTYSLDGVDAFRQSLPKRGKELIPVTASPELLRIGAGQTEDELAMLTEALSLLKTQGIEMRPQLGPLYTGLRKRLAFRESGVYALRLSCSVEQGATRELELTVDLEQMPTGNDPLRYYEYRMR